MVKQFTHQILRTELSYPRVVCAMQAQTGAFRPRQALHAQQAVRPCSPVRIRRAPPAIAQRAAEGTAGAGRDSRSRPAPAPAR
jgi:hypothetical protein